MNIFLAGGGTAKESEPIDTCFVASLDPKKPLIYIPNAMKSRPYQSCLEWLSESFEPLGAHAIEMWHDLQPRRPVQDIAGIYIGGGDTAKLLRDLRSSGFDRYVIEAVNRDIPVYGGSAGAIVLGEDIRTTPEASDISVSEAIGGRSWPPDRVPFSRKSGARSTPAGQHRAAACNRNSRKSRSAP